MYSTFSPLPRQLFPSSRVNVIICAAAALAVPARELYCSAAIKYLNLRGWKRKMKEDAKLSILHSRMGG